MNRKWMSILLCCALVVSFFVALPAPRTMAAECYSLRSGNWNDPDAWSCTAVPGSSDNVYIETGHTITLTQDQSVYDLNLNSTSAQRLVTGAYTLSINGKLRAFSGAAPGTSTTSLPTSSTWIDTSGGGKLQFVGTSRNVTNSGEWSANPKGWTAEFALTGGQTGTLGTNFKAGSLTFTSGIVDAGANVLSADTGSAGGNITIASGATVKSAASSSSTLVFQRTGSTTAGTLTIDGELILTGASPNIAASTINFNGTVEYARTSAQTMAVAANGGANPSTYTNLKLSGAAAKTLGLNTTVNGTLTLATALLKLSSYDLTLGSSASVSGTPSASNMVVTDSTGKLCKTFGAAGSFTFPIGDNTGTAEYSPVDLTVNGGSGLGDFCFRVTDAAPTHKPTGVSNYITRNWIGSTTASGPNYDATFTYLAADVVGTEASMSGKRYGSAPPWQTLGAVVVATHAFTGSGLTEMSEFTAFDTDLAATLAALDAVPAPGRVTVRWETASEADTLGFNLYRAAAGDDWTRLNAAMIPSQAPGSPFGASYRYDDAAAARGTAYHYRLAAVGMDGGETVLDAVQVSTPYWTWLAGVRW